MAITSNMTPAQAAAAFKAMRTEYVLFVESIATYKCNYGRLTRSLVVIRDKRTLKKLEKWFDIWEEHLEKLKAYGDKFNTESRAYKSPRIFYKDVSKVVLHINESITSNSVSNEDLLIALKTELARINSRLSPDLQIPADKIATLKTNQKKLRKVIKQVEKDSETEYRWRARPNKDVAAKIYDMNNRDVKARVKQVGLFILDLDKKCEVVEPDEYKSRAKRSDKYSESGIKPLDLEGIVDGEIYRQSDVKSRDKTPKSVTGPSKIRMVTV